MKSISAVASAISLGLAAATNLACAQTFPDHSIRMIIGFPPGATDSSARLIAADMSKRLGQSVVVEPLVGANGIIGAQTVVKAKPDGYTILYTPATATSPLFNPQNAVSADKELTPISNLAVTPYLLIVSGKLPVHSVAELVAYAKANPGKLNLGVTSGGGAMMVALLLNKTQGINSVYVPYNGTAPVLQAMLTGDIGWAVNTPAGWSGQFRSGTARPLFVTTAKRVSSLPDVPTAAEAGIKDLTVGTSLSLWGPRGMQPDVVQKLHDAAVAAVNDPDISKQLKGEAIGLEPVGSTPEEELRSYQEEIKVLTAGAQVANAKPQ